MNIKRFWPWKTIARLETDLARCKKDSDFLRGLHQTAREENRELKVNNNRLLMDKQKLEQRVIEQEEQLVTKDQQLRKLGTILAMKGGIAVLFMAFCITCLGQPVNRQIFTTNASGTVQQFDAPAGVVRITNTAGAHISVPYFGSPSLSTTNGEVFNERATSASVPGIGSFLVFDFFRFTCATNSPADKGNFYIGANSSLSDGSLVILQEVEGSPNISPRQWWTNTAYGDVLHIGHPFGWGLIKTNATGNALNLGALDSTVINNGGMRFTKLVLFSTIQAANGTLLAVTNINSSSLLGAVMQFMPSSTNDSMLGSLGLNWTGNSEGNTFLSANTVPNSTHGHSNVVVGVWCDLAVDGQDYGGNYQNAIWISNATTGGNTPGNTIVQFNGTINVQSTTNQVRWGATNAAPVNAATPTKWINVTINGEGVQYKMPLYQ